MLKNLIWKLELLFTAYSGLFHYIIEGDNPPLLEYYPDHGTVEIIRLFFTPFFEMIWGFLQGFWGFLQATWGFLQVIWGLLGWGHNQIQAACIFIQVTIFDPIKAYTSDRVKKVTAFLKGLQYFLMMAIKFLYVVNVLGCAFHSYGFAKDAFSIKNFNDCVNNLMQLRAYVYSFVLMALSIYAVWCKIVTNGSPISDFLTKNHLTISILFFVSHEYSGYLVDILRIPMLKFASFAYGLLICELAVEDPTFNSGLPQAALIAFIQVFVWICAQNGKDLVLIFSCVITIFAALLSLVINWGKIDPSRVEECFFGVLLSHPVVTGRYLLSGLDSKTHHTATLEIQVLGVAMKSFKSGNGASSVHLKNHITCCRSSKEDSSSSVREDEISVHGVSNKVVGVLGGGQLGQMLCQAASQMGIKVMVLDPLENCPASALAYGHVVRRFDDSAAVEEFAKRCGVLTFEIEHVDVATLEKLEQQGVDCQPKASTIRIIQDKYLQKIHFSQHGIPMPEFREINDEESAREAGGSFGYPLMIKSKRLAYDGRGNAVAYTIEDLSSCVAALGGYGHGLYVEKWTPFVAELAVIVARGRDGSLSCYPVVETIHKDNICHIVKAPAEISWKIKELATDVAQRAVRSLDGAGVFAVELFLTKDEQILLNEVAPRPHNSGHQTIESCYTSQYEQHLRAVLGLPLGNSSMKTPAAIMYNLLGEEKGEQGFALAHQLIVRAWNVPGASVHLYNKPEIRKQRKMGHITIVGPSMVNVENKLKSLLSKEDKIADGQSQATPLVGIIMGSDSDLHIMKEAAKVLDIFGVPYEVRIVSAHRTPELMNVYAKSAHKRGIQVIIAGAGGAAHLPGMVASETPLPVVAVPIRGSQLGGLDSILSMLQMPRGISTATVGINNAENAALLAVRMLAILYPDMQARMIQYQQDMTDDVLRKGDKLMDLGWEGYLDFR